MVLSTLFLAPGCGYWPFPQDDTFRILLALIQLAPVPVAIHCQEWRPRPELNWDTRFRKPLLYPFELRGHDWLRVAGTMRRFIKRVYHTIAGHRQARLRG